MELYIHQYSSRDSMLTSQYWGEICAYMYVGVRYLHLLRSRCKNPQAHKHIRGEKLCHICMLKFMIMLAFCFTMSKLHRWGKLLNLGSTLLHITYDDHNSLKGRSTYDEINLSCFQLPYRIFACQFNQCIGWLQVKMAHFQ
jgi:hypothetical protein